MARQDKTTFETKDNTVRIEHKHQAGSYTSRYLITVDEHGKLTIDSTYLGSNGLNDGKDILCVSGVNRHTMDMWIG